MLFQPQRSYTRRKRIPEFLRRAEEAGSESDGEGDGKKSPVKTKRKKPNIEEVCDFQENLEFPNNFLSFQTGEFKRFVHDKSHEFAEVDNFEMVIE